MQLQIEELLVDLHTSIVEGFLVSQEEGLVLTRHHVQRWVRDEHTSTLQDQRVDLQQRSDHKVDDVISVRVGICEDADLVEPETTQIWISWTYTEDFHKVLVDLVRSQILGVRSMRVDRFTTEFQNRLEVFVPLLYDEIPRTITLCDEEFCDVRIGHTCWNITTFVVQIIRQVLRVRTQVHTPVGELGELLDQIIVDQGEELFPHSILDRIQILIQHLCVDLLEVHVFKPMLRLTFVRGSFIENSDVSVERDVVEPIEERHHLIIVLIQIGTETISDLIEEDTEMRGFFILDLCVVHRRDVSVLTLTVLHHMNADITCNNFRCFHLLMNTEIPEWLISNTEPLTYVILC